MYDKKLPVLVSYVKKKESQCTPQTIDIIRAITERLSNQPKDKLPCITPHGTYKYINKKKVFDQLSGLLFVDLDAKDNPNLDMKGVFQNFKNLKHTFLIKWSASGKGLHILIRGQYSSKESFKANYLALAEKIATHGLKIDKSVIQLTRLMFLNKSDDIYINQDAIPFIDKIEITKPTKKILPINRSNNTISDKPWDLYNNCDHWKNLIQEHGFSFVRENDQKIYFKRDGSNNQQSANFCKKTNRFWTWSDATQLTPNEAYSPFDLLKHLNNWQTKDACKFINSLLNL